jgi:uncharacterized membrane protein
MDAPLHMDAVLRPNRSLPKAGLYVLLAALALVNLATAALMVLAFLAVSLAFRASYRQARQAERVQVSADEVHVTHEIGAHSRTVWRSPTAFTRVELEGEDEDAHVRLALSGRSLILARQLSPGERSAFARRLQDAIRAARQERYASPEFGERG